MSSNSANPTPAQGGQPAFHFGATSHEENSASLTILAVLGMFAIPPYLGYNNYQKVESGAVLKDKLTSGSATLNVSEKKVEIGDQESLKDVVAYLRRNGTENVVLELKGADKKFAIRCVTTGNAAEAIITGKQPKASEVKELTVDTQELAKICDIPIEKALKLTGAPKSQASSGIYSIKTDNAVAMGTINGEIGQVRYT